MNPFPVVRPARRGFTLLEMLVVLAVTSLFLLMGSTLIYGLMRLQQAAAWQLDSMTTWRDMADTWRRDVRLAKAGPVPVGGNKADKIFQVFELPEGTVTWKVESQHLVRVVTGQPGEKSWSLGPGKIWLEFSRISADKPDLLLRHGEDRVYGRTVQGEYLARQGGDLP